MSALKDLSRSSWQGIGDPSVLYSSVLTPAAGSAKKSAFLKTFFLAVLSASRGRVKSVHDADDTQAIICNEGKKKETLLLGTACHGRDNT